jgi:hypothetical protein
MAKSLTPKFTPQEQKFIRALIEGQTPVEAAKAADYAIPEKVGPRKAKKKHIREAVENHRLQTENNEEITPELIRRLAYQCYLAAGRGGRVLYSADGRRPLKDEATGQILHGPDLRMQLQALELLAKVTDGALASQRSQLELTASDSLAEKIIAARHRGPVYELQAHPIDAKQIADMRAETKKKYPEATDAEVTEIDEDEGSD